MSTLEKSSFMVYPLPRFHMTGGYVEITTGSMEKERADRLGSLWALRRFLFQNSSKGST